MINNISFNILSTTYKYLGQGSFTAYLSIPNETLLVETQTTKIRQDPLLRTLNTSRQPDLGPFLVEYYVSLR